MVIIASQSHSILSKGVSYLTDLTHLGMLGLKMQGKLYLSPILGFLREAPKWLFFRNSSAPFNSTFSGLSINCLNLMASLPMMDLITRTEQTVFTLAV